MLVLSQDKTEIINLDNSIEIIAMEKKPYTSLHFVRVFFTCGEFTDIGGYRTQERTMEVVQEIFYKYAEHTGNDKNFIFNYLKPKVYEMPEE